MSFLNKFSKSNSSAYQKPTEADYLYPESKKLSDGMLKVSDLHSVYYREYGNPKGEPVFFLHGGPGGGCREADYRYFDPKKYRIILMDQRGSGKSTPFAELKDNNTDELVKDVNRLRDHLGVKGKMHVFGGSWGSTFSLVYAIRHPENVKSLSLRGIFLGSDLDFFWQADAADLGNSKLMGTSRYFPEYWRQYVEFIPEAERGNMVEAYHKRLFKKLPDLSDAEATKVQLEAAKRWSAWEGATSKLDVDPEYIKAHEDAHKALPFARIENLYFINKCFLPENYIMDNLDKIKDIPTFIVGGRYDCVCQPEWGIQLREGLEKAGNKNVEFKLTIAGHSASEAETTKELVARMDRLDKGPHEQKAASAKSNNAGNSRG